MPKSREHFPPVPYPETQSRLDFSSDIIFLIIQATPAAVVALGKRNWIAG
jgi:hypothetical protein